MNSESGLAWWVVPGVVLVGTGLLVFENRGLVTGLKKMCGILGLLWGRKSGPREPNLPPSLTKDENLLNDSLWELHSPNGIPEMDIIFFHGLQLGDFEDAFWKTWLAKGKDQLIWPKEWLSEALPHARILSVSYNSSATQTAGQTDMYALGENLVGDIIQDTEIDIGQNRPVFLVGHSLGGIVIKQFILSAILKKNSLHPEKFKKQIDRITTFLENFRGVFYYATPHGGSKIADLASRVPSTSPILGLLKTLNTERVRINEEFRQQRTNLNAEAFAVAEGLATTSMGFSATVVEEGSARLDIDNYYTHRAADHFTVCKARDKKDPAVIKKLTRFIAGALEDGTRTHLQEAHSS